MKKQNKIIIGVILGVAVVILFVSLLFPSVYKGLTSGSFGKAEKYHQEQISENDIQFRSEFTKDTVKLRQMISGMIYFTLFCNDLNMTVDTCIAEFKVKGYGKDQAAANAVKLLSDYNTFLKNNNKMLAKTTRMLTDFLLRDTSAQSNDVEKNLREFGMFLSQVNQKDSVLMIALTSMDSFILANRDLQKQKDEIRKLKAVRDQLVIKLSQFMALTGNRTTVGVLLSYAVQSQKQFSQIKYLKPLGAEVVSGTSELSSDAMDLSSGKVNSVIDLNAVIAEAKKNKQKDVRVVTYNAAELSIGYRSPDDLKKPGAPGMNANGSGFFNASDQVQSTGVDVGKNNSSPGQNFGLNATSDAMNAAGVNVGKNNSSPGQNFGLNAMGPEGMQAVGVNVGKNNFSVGQNPGIMAVVQAFPALGKCDIMESLSPSPHGGINFMVYVSASGGAELGKSEQMNSYTPSTGGLMNGIESWSLHGIDGLQAGIALRGFDQFQGFVQANIQGFIQAQGEIQGVVRQ